MKVTNPNWKSRERETGRERDGNGTGTGNENLREAAGAETARSSRLLSSREPGTTIGLRTHGSLTLFMNRTRKNCRGEGTTINSIIVRVKYLFSSHYSQDCTLYAAQDLLNPLPPLDGCQDRIG